MSEHARLTSTALLAPMLCTCGRRAVLKASGLPSSRPTLERLLDDPDQMALPL